MSFAERRNVVPVRLQDGLVVGVEVQASDDPERPVGIGKELSFDRLTESIEAIATRVTRALETSKPQRATVEFGLDVAVESGGLTALLVKGSGTATLKITLEWSSASAG